MKRLVAALAIALAAATACPAAAHVPPPPPDDKPFVAASCTGTAMGVPDPVAATVARRTDTPAAAPDAGSLALRWGMRLSTRDPRVGDLTSLAFSGAYGLLATTRRGDWLTFDLQNGSLADVKAVGVAPIRGAAGLPTSLVDLGGGLSFMAFENAAGSIARLALSTCGTNAIAVPWLTTRGTTSPVVVQAAYTDLGVVASDAAHGDRVLLPYDKQPVTVPQGANAFVPAGEHLIALSNPARIVPYVLALTRLPAGRRGATLRLVVRDEWSDVRGGPATAPRTILRLIRTPSAMASFMGSSGVTTVILAFPTATPGTIDLYRFDGTL